MQRPSRNEARPECPLNQDLGSGFVPPQLLNMLTHEQESLSGQQIGNYEIVELIAARKVSDLYLARDIKLERLVYLEVLRTTADEDADLAARFQRRMETVSQLKHDGIALVSDIDFTEDNLPYAVIEHFPATTLANKLEELNEKGELLPVIEALRLTQQIAQALSAAHSAGLVHHDLRPENIMLREDGTPVLLDLGVPIVVTADSMLNQADGDVIHYASPEEMEGKTIGRRSNIYSLGVILYELLAGHRPRLPTLPYDIFPQANMPKEEPLEEAREGLTGETYRLVRNCLWRQEWSRFETAEEMITAIETAILAEQELPKTPAWTGSRRRSIYALLPIAIIGLLALGFLVVWNSFGNNNDPQPTEPATTAAEGLGSEITATPRDSDATTAESTSTSSPIGDSIRMGAPASNRQFTRSDQINFNWFWLNVLNPGERFTVYILDGEDEYRIEPSLTEPDDDDTYRLTVNAADIPTDSTELAWQVRLEDVSSGEVKVLVTSNTIPFTILPSTPTATATSSLTPTRTPTPTATASQTPTQEACVPSPPSDWVLYSIQLGDSVAGLAEARNVTPEFIMEVNCLEDDELSINQQLYLPPLPATPTQPPPPTQPPSGGVTAVPPDPTDTPGAPPPPPPPPPDPSDTPEPDPPTSTAPPPPTEPSPP